MKSSILDRIGGLFPSLGEKARKDPGRTEEPQRQVVMQQQISAVDYMKATAVYPGLIKLDDCYF